MTWQPAASRKALAARAALLASIRAFFQARRVLEVETPLLGTATAPERHMEPLPCRGGYLRTSPEMEMKRLLAAGSGPIYQICRAFRQDEAGPLHNPEFTILEWYRPGWDWQELMAEVEALTRDLLGIGPARRLTYRQAFLDHAGIDPFSADRATLEAAVRGAVPGGLDRPGLLDLLLLQRVEPALKQSGGAVFLSDFPPWAAAMARIDPGPPAVAQRFELYVDGVELANGYQELTDAAEQRRRLEAVNRERATEGAASLPLDARFLQALEAGLPGCAGVAMGVDRLLMCRLQATDLREVLAFPHDRV